MNREGKILRMFCPYCGQEMYKNKTEMNISNVSFLYSRKPKSELRDDFRCKDCVHIFSFSWLDWSYDWEHLVLREGESKIKWTKNGRKHLDGLESRK